MSALRLGISCLQKRMPKSVKPGIDDNLSTCVPGLQLFGIFFGGGAIYKFDAQQTNMPRLQVEPKKNYRVNSLVLR